jgi:hypothetical protein
MTRSSFSFGIGRGNSELVSNPVFESAVDIFAVIEGYPGTGVYLAEELDFGADAPSEINCAQFFFTLRA